MRGGDVFLCCKKAKVLMKGESDRMNEYQAVLQRDFNVNLFFHKNI